MPRAAVTDFRGVRLQQLDNLRIGGCLRHDDAFDHFHLGLDGIPLLEQRVGRSALNDDFRVALGLHAGNHTNHMAHQLRRNSASSVSVTVRIPSGRLVTLRVIARCFMNIARISSNSACGVLAA